MALLIGVEMAAAMSAFGIAPAAMRPAFSGTLSSLTSVGTTPPPALVGLITEYTGVTTASRRLFIAPSMSPDESDVETASSSLGS
ncbi:Uncharacterised protein [Mycobacteroides abscessus subsp. abscessus]|nr:Uncharacterised protein [Mycobacteroides abscessus subsp. abscessus]